MIDSSEILNQLHVGADNAVSAKSLSNLLGITERELRRIVRSARLDGNVIIGDRHGYYLPASQEEQTRFYKLFRKRALCSLASVHDLYPVVKQEETEIPGQLSIFDFVEEQW